MSLVLPSVELRPHCLAIPNRNYWDGTLYMLALLHVSGTFHLWY